MSCIITYKGKQYPEEKFKEYFINNKNEFTTSISKNKDVIDSFKRKMEAIDGVFKESPELAAIGTKAQYMQYLSTIFKTSQVKDILYHGSHTDFTFRDYITSQPEYTGSITTAVWVDGVRDDDRSIIRSLSDAEKKEYQKNGRIETGEGFYQKDGTIKYFKNSELDKLYNEGKFEKFKKRDHSYAGMDTFLGTGNYFTTSLKDAKVYARNKLYAVIADIKNAYTENKGYSNSRSGKGSQELIDKGYDAVTEKVNNGQEYNIFEPEQIHILSSKADIQGFKDYMAFQNGEFSKYGTNEQFRQFIINKSSMEIENRSIETGKIDRVC